MDSGAFPSVMIPDQWFTNTGTDQTPSFYSQDSSSNQEKLSAQQHNIANNNNPTLSLGHMSNNPPQSNPTEFSHLNESSFTFDQYDLPPINTLPPSQFNTRPSLPPSASDPSTISRSHKRTHSSFQSGTVKKDTEEQKDSENTSLFHDVNDKQHVDEHGKQTVSGLRSEVRQYAFKVTEQFNIVRKVTKDLQDRVTPRINELCNHFEIFGVETKKTWEYVAQSIPAMRTRLESCERDLKLLDRQLSELKKVMAEMKQSRS